MSEPMVIPQYLRTARRHLATGNRRTAIEWIRRALGMDPTHSEAHSLLASALLDDRRLHAALYEAHEGVRLEPESEYAHRVLALCYLAHRKLKKAREHAEHAIELEPDSALGYLVQGNVAEVSGHKSEALEAFQKARALDPESPDVLSALAEAYLARGRLADADACAREALEIEPESAEALVAMGKLHLLRGEIQMAKDHALWAIRTEPDARRALYLMASIKARESLLLGLWWRFNAWLGRMSDGRIVLVLLGAFVLQRLGVVYCDKHGLEMTSSIIHYGWIGLCIYSWVGPVMFQRAVKRELDEIQLSRDF